MGIGADAFRRAFAAQLCAIELEGAEAGFIDGVYVDPVYGFGFACPPDWRGGDLTSLGRTAEGRLLNSHDDRANDAVREVSQEHLPLAVTLAPALDDPVARIGPIPVAPLVSVHLEAEFAGDEDHDLLAWVREDLAIMHGLIEDYRLVEGPARLVLSACDAVTFTVTYTMLHADAVEGCPTRERAVYVLQDPTVYAFRMCDYPRRDPRLAFDFDEIVASILIR